MTTIIIDRAVVEQALDALEAVCGGRCNAEYNPCWQREVAETLRAALAQQAEPVAVDAAYQRWLEDTHAPALRRMDSQGAFAAGWQAAPPQQAEPVASLNAWAEQRLARHGIQACLYPNCVGGQSGTVCHKHCPTPCTDCRGIGYDASGQLCGCQQNPSF